MNFFQKHPSKEEVETQKSQTKVVAPQNLPNKDQSPEGNSPSLRIARALLKKHSLKFPLASFSISVPSLFQQTETLDSKGWPPSWSAALQRLKTFPLMDSKTLVYPAILVSHFLIQRLPTEHGTLTNSFLNEELLLVKAFFSKKKKTKTSSGHSCHGNRLGRPRKNSESFFKNQNQNQKERTKFVVDQYFLLPFSYLKNKKEYQETYQDLQTWFATYQKLMKSYCLHDYKKESEDAPSSFQNRLLEHACYWSSLSNPTTLFGGSFPWIFPFSNISDSETKGKSHQYYGFHKNKDKRRIEKRKRHFKHDEFVKPHTSSSSSLTSEQVCILVVFGRTQEGLYKTCLVVRDPTASSKTFHSYFEALQQTFGFGNDTGKEKKTTQEKDDEKQKSPYQKSHCFFYFYPLPQMVGWSNFQEPFWVIEEEKGKEKRSLHTHYQQLSVLPPTLPFSFQSTKEAEEVVRDLIVSGSHIPLVIQVEKEEENSVHAFLQKEFEKNDLFFSPMATLSSRSESTGDLEDIFENESNFLLNPSVSLGSTPLGESSSTPNTPELWGSQQEFKKPHNDLFQPLFPETESKHLGSVPPFSGSLVSTSICTPTKPSGTLAELDLSFVGDLPEEFLNAAEKKTSFHFDEDNLDLSFLEETESQKKTKKTQNEFGYTTPSTFQEPFLLPLDSGATSLFQKTHDKDAFDFQISSYVPQSQGYWFFQEVLKDLLENPFRCSSLSSPSSSLSSSSTFSKTTPVVIVLLLSFSSFMKKEWATALGFAGASTSSSLFQNKIHQRQKLRKHQPTKGKDYSDDVVVLSPTRRNLENSLVFLLENDFLQEKKALFALPSSIQKPESLLTSSFQTLSSNERSFVIEKAENALKEVCMQIEDIHCKFAERVSSFSKRKMQDYQKLFKNNLETQIQTQQTKFQSNLTRCEELKAYYFREGSHSFLLFSFFTVIEITYFLSPFQISNALEFGSLFTSKCAEKTYKNMLQTYSSFTSFLNKSLKSRVDTKKEIRGDDKRQERNWKKLSLLPSSSVSDSAAALSLSHATDHQEVKEKERKEKSEQSNNNQQSLFDTVSLAHYSPLLQRLVSKRELHQSTLTFGLCGSFFDDFTQLSNWFVLSSIVYRVHLKSRCLSTTCSLPHFVSGTTVTLPLSEIRESFSRDGTREGPETFQKRYLFPSLLLLPNISRRKKAKKNQKSRWNTKETIQEMFHENKEEEEEEENQERNLFASVEESLVELGFKVWTLTRLPPEANATQQSESCIKKQTLNEENKKRKKESENVVKEKEEARMELEQGKGEEEARKLGPKTKLKATPKVQLVASEKEFFKNMEDGSNKFLDVVCRNIIEEWKNADYVLLPCDEDLPFAVTFCLERSRFWRISICEAASSLHTFFTRSFCFHKLKLSAKNLHYVMTERQAALFPWRSAFRVKNLLEWVNFPCSSINFPFENDTDVEDRKQKNSDSYAFSRSTSTAKNKEIYTYLCLLKSLSVILTFSTRPEPLFSTICAKFQKWMKKNLILQSGDPTKEGKKPNPQNENLKFQFACIQLAESNKSQKDLAAKRKLQIQNAWKATCEDEAILKEGIQTKETNFSATQKSSTLILSQHQKSESENESEFMLETKSDDCRELKEEEEKEDHTNSTDEEEAAFEAREKGKSFSCFSNRSSFFWLETIVLVDDDERAQRKEDKDKETARKEQHESQNTRSDIPSFGFPVSSRKYHENIENWKLFFETNMLRCFVSRYNIGKLISELPQDVMLQCKKLQTYAFTEVLLQHSLPPLRLSLVSKKVYEQYRRLLNKSAPGSLVPVFPFLLTERDSERTKVFRESWKGTGTGTDRFAGMETRTGTLSIPTFQVDATHCQLGDCQKEETEYKFQTQTQTQRDYKENHRSSTRVRVLALPPDVVPEDNIKLLHRASVGWELSFLCKSCGQNIYTLADTMRHQLAAFDFQAILDCRIAMFPFFVSLLCSCVLCWGCLRDIGLDDVRYYYKEKKTERWNQFCASCPFWPNCETKESLKNSFQKWSIICGQPNLTLSKNRKLKLYEKQKKTGKRKFANLKLQNLKENKEENENEEDKVCETEQTFFIPSVNPDEFPRFENKVSSRSQKKASLFGKRVFKKHTRKQKSNKKKSKKDQNQFGVESDEVFPKKKKKSKKTTDKKKKVKRSKFDAYLDPSSPIPFVCDAEKKHFSLLQRDDGEEGDKKRLPGGSSSSSSLGTSSSLPSSLNSHFSSLSKTPHSSGDPGATGTPSLNHIMNQCLLCGDVCSVSMDFAQDKFLSVSQLFCGHLFHSYCLDTIKPPLCLWCGGSSERKKICQIEDYFASKDVFFNSSSNASQKVFFNSSKSQTLNKLLQKLTLSFDLEQQHQQPQPRLHPRLLDKAKASVGSRSNKRTCQIFIISPDMECNQKMKLHFYREFSLFSKEKTGQENFVKYSFPDSFSFDCSENNNKKEEPSLHESGYYSVFSNWLIRFDPVFRTFEKISFENVNSNRNENEKMLSLNPQVQKEIHFVCLSDLQKALAGRPKTNEKEKPGFSKMDRRDEKEKEIPNSLDVDQNRDVHLIFPQTFFQPADLKIVHCAFDIFLSLWSGEYCHEFSFYHPQDPKIYKTFSTTTTIQVWWIRDPWSLEEKWGSFFDQELRLVVPQKTSISHFDLAQKNARTTFDKWNKKRRDDPRVNLPTGQCIYSGAQARDWKKKLTEFIFREFDLSWLLEFEKAKRKVDFQKTHQKQLQKK